MTKDRPSFCKNSVAGMEIIYTPDKGYRGPDAFEIGIRFQQYIELPTGTSYNSQGYKLNVK